MLSYENKIDTLTLLLSRNNLRLLQEISLSGTGDYFYAPQLLCGRE